MQYTHLKKSFLVLCSLFTLAAENAHAQQEQKQQKQQAQAQQAPAPAVGFVSVNLETIKTTKNLPARLEASRTAVVRARVNGIVEQRLFKEGAYVLKDTPLFQIDDTPFRAQLAAAQAQLAQAEANYKLNQADLGRYKKLVKAGAISKQTYDQAEATLASTKANIEAAKAAITDASLNLKYARVSAPINGYIGQADVTEGALVSAVSATQMAQIQQIDPLYVNIRQPATEILKLKQALHIDNDALERANVKINVYLDDGTPYAHQGTLLFADVNVDESTGEASLRATLPNPDKLLMPGLYVRVDVPQLEVKNAALIPQQAVTRGVKDTVFVVNPDNTYAPRVVSILQAQGNNWLVTDGLKQGDKVIVDGMQMVMMTRASHVTPVPWQAGKAPAAPADPKAASKP